MRERRHLIVDPLLPRHIPAPESLLGPHIEHQRTLSLAGQIFGPLLGEFPFEHSGALPDLDHVPVGVAHVAADLGDAVDRRCHELGPL